MKIIDFFINITSEPQGTYTIIIKNACHDPFKEKDHQKRYFSFGGTISFGQMIKYVFIFKTLV